MEREEFTKVMTETCPPSQTLATSAIYNGLTKTFQTPGQEVSGRKCPSAFSFKEEP